MAENMTATHVSSGGGPEFIRSPRGIEIVKLQGSSTSADDTSNVYSCQGITKPAFVIGAAIGSTISGATVVFKSKVALGDDAMYVIVCEAI